MAFERLRGAIISLLSGNKDSIYDRRGNSFLPAWSKPPNQSTEGWLDTYGKSPRLGVVSKIAEDLSFAEGRLIFINDEGEDEVLPENHPFWSFWNEPNPLPQFTKEAIWQLHQEYLLLIGEGYMVIEKDAFGYPAELWPIPPHWVMGTPSAGNPYYLIRTPSGFMGQVHVDDMFVQMELNPADPYGRGLGKAQGIADEVEIDEFAADFEKRFFYNDATPSSVIGIEGADADAVKRFKAEWNNEHRGVENSHKTAVTSGKVTVAKLAENMKDLDMVNGRIFLRDTILEHFHVPREIVGITENSNRSTAEAAQFIYAQNVLTPFLHKRKSAVNSQLVPYWGENIRFEFDEIIPQNQEYEKALANEGWASGYVTLNEARKKVAMEPVDNGDVFQAPMLFGYVNATQDLTAGSTSSAYGGVSDYYDTVTETIDEHGAKQVKASISGVDQRAIQLLERTQREQQRRAENITAQHFSRQRSTLLTAIRKTGEGSKAEASTGGEFAAIETQLVGVTDPILRAEIVTNFVESLADWGSDQEQIRSMLTGIWTDSYTQGKNIMEELYNLQNPYKPDVRDVFQRMGGQQIASDISATTKERISEIIDRGLAEGSDLNEIARQIGDCGDLSPSRARFIAEQETYNSVSAANFDSMESGGIKEHKWVTRGDGDVRDSHARMNGEVQRVGDRFSNGLRYPRDRDGAAAEVLKCRCWNAPLRNAPS